MNKALLWIGGGLGLYWLLQQGNNPAAGSGSGMSGADGGPCTWVAPTGDLVLGVIGGGGTYCQVNVAGYTPNGGKIPMNPLSPNGPRPGTS